MSSSLIDVANELVELCRQGRFLQALELYAEDAVSIEPIDLPPHLPREVQGREAITEKGKAWGAAHKVHEISVRGPFVGGSQFAVFYAFDVTVQATGERSVFREMGLYDVSEDNQITREEFFYNAT